VLERLGGGGMGVVYHAEDTRLTRPVALKFLTPRHAGEVVALMRFRREARLASSLTHPNICTIYEIDEFEGQPFIAMEFLVGHSLKQKIQSERPSQDELLAIAIQVCEALDAAHGKGIVHRDVKPANVFLTAEGRVKVLDFGLAKYSHTVSEGESDESTASVETHERLIAGTVAYMSPEQVLNQPLDQRSDLFSLGSMLFEMATGRRPFRTASALETMNNIVHTEPEPLTRLTVNHSPELSRIVGKLLIKDREQRYQTAKAALVDLQRLKQQVEIGQSDFVLPLRRADTPEPSVAVLPFLNLGPDPDIEYFCDGMAEELTAALSKVRRLRVAARVSAFGFKHRSAPIPTIGKRLKVATVLEGSVRKAGDRLRITVQLVNVADGYQIWCERYDRKIDDVFVVEDEIARSIVEKFKVAALPGGSLVRHHTENRAAHELYLKGRFYWSKRLEGGLRIALQHFERSIQEDPGYALAYSGIADAHVFLGLYSLRRPKDAFQKAREAADIALTIDEELPEAHVSQALIKLGADWDWPGAKREFERALELDPTQALAHIYYSWLLVLMGHSEEAFAEARCGQEFDPLSPLLNSTAGYTFFLARHYYQAVELCQAALEVDQNFLVALYVMGMCYGQMGLLKESIELLERAASVSQRSPFFLGLLGKYCAEAKQTQKAVALLAELDGLTTSIYVPPHAFAYIRVGLGDYDRALDWQERACEDGASPFNYFSPAIEKLHPLPRHKEHLRRMGLDI